LLPSHVREAKAEISPGFEKELLLSLGLHEKLILLALARYLEQIELGYLTMGDLREQYCIACEEYGRRALGYTSFWKRLKNLADLGLISAKTSGKGFRGRTTLVGLLVPADKLRQEIEGLLRG
jgi:cell division control protein 6